MAYTVCECAALSVARQEIARLREMVWLLYGYGDLPRDTLLTQKDLVVVEASRVVWQEEKTRRIASQTPRQE